MATKQELRRWLLADRRHMSEAESLRLSKLICDRLSTVLTGLHVRSLHYFEPIRANREIDIVPAVRELAESDRAMLLAASRRYGSGWEDVRPDGAPVPDGERYGCVIVPMLGFDRSLHRIGYGGGHYDRFLKRQVGAVRIGVCFDVGKVEFEANDHDVPMDLIITEAAVYRQGITP